MTGTKTPLIRWRDAGQRTINWLIFKSNHNIKDQADITEGAYLKRAALLLYHPDPERFWNPGELPETWTVKKLLAQDSSRPFNPLVANAFFCAGPIEAWGRGI